MSGARTRLFHDDDDDEEWVEPGKKKQRKISKVNRRTKKAAAKKAAKTFDNVDAQEGSAFLSRIFSSLRVFLLTRHLGFRDCLAFARSCKITYLDMVSNPLFLRYYVRNLLDRHQLAEYHNEYQQLCRLAPFARASDMVFLNRMQEDRQARHVFLLPKVELQSGDESTWNLASCVSHMDDAKRALATPGFEFNSIIKSLGSVSHRHPVNVDGVVEGQLPHWSTRLSSILLSWVRGTGGCLSEWREDAWENTVLFLLLHTFDLDGSVFASYFTNIHYLKYYRKVTFSNNNNNGTLLVDFWQMLNGLFDNSAASMSNKEGCPRLLLRSHLYMYDDLSRTKARRPSQFGWRVLRSVYFVHEHLARELHDDWMEPVEISDETWKHLSKLTYVDYQSSRRKMAHVVAKLTYWPVTAIELHVGALALPQLLGLQVNSLFYPRKELWLQWRHCVTHRAWLVKKESFF